MKWNATYYSGRVCMPPYNFDEQYAIGMEGEKDLDEYLRSLGYAVELVSRSEQRRGMDRNVRHREFPWIEFRVEYKADSKAAETGNGFIELESAKGVPGGFTKSEALYIVHYIPPTSVLRWVLVRLMQLYIPTWLVRYPDIKAMHNEQNGREWVTRGIAVPLVVLDRTVVIAQGTLAGRRKEGEAQEATLWASELPVRALDCAIAEYRAGGPAKRGRQWPQPNNRPRR
jgi:hypothetical protein